MNIFYLDSNAKTSAEMHLDKHVSKMLVEYAQLMSTAHRVLDGTEWYDKNKIGRKIKRWRVNENSENILYKASHVNHPSNVWTRTSKHNYAFLYEMWCHLHEEFKIRYGKEHMSYIKLNEVLKYPPINISDSPFSQPLQAMPEDVKNADSVVAYRNYYMKYKKDFATWKTKQPEWFTVGMVA
ncbi:MAG: hypothetical protein H8D95_01020 [Candidatus Endolissoclinum sp.]|nr:hypothetical protein [Candidatus Endolissoclinum sp.]